MPLTHEEIEERFRYHEPSKIGMERHARLSAAMRTAARSIHHNCPEGREKSLAMTKLEEAKFWASAAVARNPETR